MEKVCAGYGDKVILKSIKLNLVPGLRIGLLGRNGIGKSILIKLLTGSLPPLSSEIGLAKGIKLGYFAQHQLEYLHADESPLQHLSRITHGCWNSSYAILWAVSASRAKSDRNHRLFLRWRKGTVSAGADRLATP